MSSAVRNKKAPGAATPRALDNVETTEESNVMTNNTTIADMREFVQAKDGQAFTTSQRVAEAFGKQHYHVLAKLRELDCSDHFLTHNFSWVQFEHRGNSYDAAEMTKDGFMFLVMGFTGKKAAAIKEGYIAAFNWMAEKLGADASDVVNAVISSSGVALLDQVIEQKAEKVRVENRRSFKLSIKSLLRSHFGVQRTELIPVGQLADACHFVTDYVLEGEWLGKEPEKQDGLNIHYPVSFLTDQHPGILKPYSDSHDWLDLTLEQIDERSTSAVESILHELNGAGYQIDAAWFEIRTYRNKFFHLKRALSGFHYALESPQDFLVNREVLV